MVRLSRELKKIDIGTRLEEVKVFLSDHVDVAAAFLFGSYGTEFQNNLSDLDIAVLLIPGRDAGLDLIGSLHGTLTDIAGTDDVNVVILNKVPITLQFEVLSTGRLLFKKETYLEEFHEFVCKRYADFKIDLDSFYADYDDALREVYLRGQ
jgi:predicted nucleotidyltransferase